MSPPTNNEFLKVDVVEIKYLLQSTEYSLQNNESVKHYAVICCSQTTSFICMFNSVAGI